MISGYTVTRDCIAGDYCFELTIRSLAALCDEVVVSDAASIDGTRERIEQLRGELGIPIRICEYPREEPNGDKEFLTRWINWTRGKLAGETQIYLDADELMNPWDSERILMLVEPGKPLWCKRLNFWGDHRHITPPGVVCGDEVVRVGPKSYWMPSDEPHEPETPMRVDAVKGGPIIWHYGFIRRSDGFLKKSKWFQNALVGDFDARLKRSMETGEDWRVLAPCPSPPIPYEGPHPQIARSWLAERGFHL